MLTQSQNLFKQANKVLVGGVNSPVRAFKGVGGDPIFFEKGEGAYVFDVDGNRYVDFVGSWGCLILGHNHPSVRKSVEKAIQNGLGFGAPTQAEVELAELIIKLMPNLEKIRMVNSGTEATLTAIRLARGYTKRNKIIKFIGGYHGHSDSLLVKAGSGVLTLSLPDSPGVPLELAQHTLVAPFNDFDAVEKLFKSYGSEIAAIIIEPICGNMNFILPENNFLPKLRDLTTQYGALFICDEVMTGFRVGLKGAQDIYAIKPDITCLGKVIGGGLPVGALAGPAHIMDQLAPSGPIYQAGTLSGNPITAAAGFATLSELNEEKFENLNKQTDYFIRSLETIAKKHQVPFHAQGLGGMFGLYFTDKKPVSNLAEAANC
ncbi:MAG: glutamate-semialdehyde--aminomutase, partial [Francisellaceae bacterium]|nr:glutamate-semialdehyde--aminomutase [Francisellaceae bacterium]